MTSSSVVGTWRPQAREHLLTATKWLIIISPSARTTSRSWAFLAVSTQSNSRQHGECESVHTARGTILTACSDRPTICRHAGHPPVGPPMRGTLTGLRGNRSEGGASLNQPAALRKTWSVWKLSFRLRGLWVSKRCFNALNIIRGSNYNFKKVAIKPISWCVSNDWSLIFQTIWYDFKMKV